MDRWQITAIAIAIGLVAASFYFTPTAPVRAPQAPPAAAAPAPEPSPVARSVPETPAAPEAPPSAAGRLVTLRNDAVELRVSNTWTRVESVELLRYRATVDRDSAPVQLVTTPMGAMSVSLGDDAALRAQQEMPAEVTSSSPTAVELRSTHGGITVTRKVELDDEGYGGHLSLAIQNASSATIRPSIQVIFDGHERAATAPDHFPRYSLVVSADGATKRMPLQGIASTGFVGTLLGRGPPTSTRYASPVEWAGVDSQYFLIAAVAQNPRESVAVAGPLGSYALDSGSAVLGIEPFDVPPGTGVERSYRLYFGPKIEDTVVGVDPQLGHAIDAGWSFVRPLVSAFGGMLHWTYDHVVANYGVAIILLTILVRLVTYPLTQRSMKSMKKFGLIAPQMKEIQEKYANDRDKLQEELMKLYRQKGMNPLSAVGGGCVPMLIQMPVMIALYFALQTSIDLRHAPFALWIHDLSAPENFFSIAGVPIRLLPLLMGGSMLLQQRLSPAPNADPQQRQMMTLMSFMFTFMFYQFPAGLVLYWFVSNLLGIAQQLLVNRSPQPATKPSEKAA
ncbi:MAG TPA: membrane protein insertase YidC [Myxococcota bacterium]|nr:membrane protein insertase YidC [Myxococcota bacterium]